jgi:hypothetical protein
MTGRAGGPTTHRATTPEGTPLEPVAGGLAAAIAPEGVAGILSIGVIVALLTARLAFGGAGTTVPTPSPTAAPTVAPTATPARFDTVATRTLLQVDRYLQVQGKVLQGELKSPPVNTANVRYSMSQIGIQLLQGVPAAKRLAATPDGQAIGTELGAVYTELSQTIDKANTISLQIEPTWRQNAANVVATLDRLPGLDAQLELLLAGGPTPSGSVEPSTTPTTLPSPSVSPSPTIASPSASPSPSPTATPAPTATPPPTVGPSPSPGPNPLVDPGFESGVGAPWSLVVSDTTAAATATPDGAVHHTGSFSARIDISAPSGKRAGIAFQQGGLTVEAAAIYHVSLFARSTTQREIRIRITSATGQTLGNGTNLFTIGPDWVPLAFDFSSILGDTEAVFAIELGQGAETVWVDDASIVRIPPGAP